MNDAEVSAASGPAPRRVAFFQVVLTQQTPDTPLPVQPFLACAGDVVARLGRLRSAAVQVLLPAHDPPASGRQTSVPGAVVSEHLLFAANWFGDTNSPVSVRVTLDGGPDLSIRRAAADLFGWTRESRQDAFACHALSLEDRDHLILWPDLPLWPAQGGEEASFAHHHITLIGTIAEWSLDAVGWLCAWLAEGSARNGVHGPLMFSADRVQNAATD